MMYRIGREWAWVILALVGLAVVGRLVTDWLGSR